MKFLFGQQVHSHHLQGSVATIGNFDGVHLGHQALLLALREQAQQEQLPSVVILFEPQAREYLNPIQAPARLTSLRAKLTMIQRMGVDQVMCLRFQRALAQMSPEAFAEDYIFSRLNVKWLIVGGDFRFGLDRKGDISLLREMATRHHCQVVTLPEYIFEGQRVSSTAIRNALASRDLVLAERFLGRPFSYSGRVLKGQGIGRQWGVPTANIRMTHNNFPLSGIYCVQVERSNGARYQGVASLGTRPTMGSGGQCILEVNLFNFDGNLYGECLHVTFLHFLREEENFSSVDVLIQQIFLDIKQTKSYFNITE